MVIDASARTRVGLAKGHYESAGLVVMVVVDLFFKDAFVLSPSSGLRLLLSGNTTCSELLVCVSGLGDIWRGSGFLLVHSRVACEIAGDIRFAISSVR